MERPRPIDDFGYADTVWIEELWLSLYHPGMELRQLRYFRQIALSGSFSAASGVLRIAQPALSRQVETLERELRTKLFHRTGRGVMMTAAGRLLLADAERLIDDADRMATRARAFGNIVAGDATVGLSPTIGRLLTLPLAQKVRAEYPDLSLRISEGFSGTLLEWLRTGRLDAAILYHMPTGSGVRSEIVANEPLSIIGGPADPPFPVGSRISINALVGRSMVLSTPSHGLRQMIDRQAAAAGAKLDLLFELDSLDAMIALVKQGMALTILPESAVRAELAAGTLLAWRIGDPEFVRPLIIATAMQRQDAIGVREIAGLLRDVIISASAQCGWRVVAGDG